MTDEIPALEGTRIMSKYIGKIISSDAVDEVVHAIVIENYAKRSQQGRLTGEWIVFAKTPTENVYLTLASHQESDKEIADRLAAYQTLGFLGKD
jgi:hypothetical protein